MTDQKRLLKIPAQRGSIPGDGIEQWEKALEKIMNAFIVFFRVLLHIILSNPHSLYIRSSHRFLGLFSAVVCVCLRLYLFNLA